MHNRKIDELGRICLPIDFRKKNNLTTGSEVIFSCNNGKIIIEPANSKCLICGSTIKNKYDIKVCDQCVNKIKKL